jgi:hypothetical protein
VERTCPSAAAWKTHRQKDHTPVLFVPVSTTPLATNKVFPAILTQESHRQIDLYVFANLRHNSHLISHHFFLDNFNHGMYVGS